MVLAFCRRGSVIPICFYLLVGGYMKERKSGLRGGEKEARRQREAAFVKELLHSAAFYYHIKKRLFHFPTKSLFILASKFRDRRDSGRLCSPRNDPKFSLGLF